MTYEEYKNESNNNSNNFFRSIFSKLFTIVIFCMIVIIISNTNEKFKNFLINDVLNNTMDFSKMNNLLDRFTNVYKNDNKEEQVFNEIKESEEYMDGYKYYVNEKDNIVMRDSGIITFIGEKEGYGNVVIVQQSNGYYAWYGNIKESVKLYDYIEKGEYLGNSISDFYYYVLYKDDKPIKYEN